MEARPPRHAAADLDTLDHGAADERARRLTGAIRSGDHAALEEFYREWRGWCESVARDLSALAGEEPMDIVHDAMIRVARTSQPVRSDAALRAWLRRVIVSAALDRARARRRREARDRGTRGPSRSDGPGDGLEAGEACLRLERELSALPMPDHALLRLRAVTDLSHARLAALLRTTEGSIHARLRRLHRALRERIEPGEGDSGD